jgi:hypothetical protein
MPAILQTALLAFAIVMAGMVLLTGLCFLLRAVATPRLARAGAPGPATVADPLLIAVLAAAASEALGRPVRLHRVHLRGTAERERWSRAGRMDVMVSHRVGPRR